LTTNRSLLECANHDVFRLVIAPHLELKDIQSMDESCRQLHGIFKTTLNDIGAARLLKYVINADWPNVKKLAAARPEFMFIPAKGIDIDGTPIKITPLHYALFVHDIYSLRIFNECAQDRHLQTFLEVLQKQQRPDKRQQTGFYGTNKILKQMVDRWVAGEDLAGKMQDYLHNEMREMSARQGYLSLEPLFWAYTQVLELARQDHQFDFVVLSNQLLGFAQANLMPRHMLQQMRAFNQKWSFDADFFNQTPPEMFNTAVRFMPDSHLVAYGVRDAVLGQNTMLIRGDSELQALSIYMSSIEARLHIDECTFRNLAITRLAQVREMITYAKKTILAINTEKVSI
jgi:hypothetical protein